MSNAHKFVERHITLNIYGGHIAESGNKNNKKNN